MPALNFMAGWKSISCTPLLGALVFLRGKQRNEGKESPVTSHRHLSILPQLPLGGKIHWKDQLPIPGVAKFIFPTAEKLWVATAQTMSQAVVFLSANAQRHFLCHHVRASESDFIMIPIKSPWRNLCCSFPCKYFKFGLLLEFWSWYLCN